MSPSRAVPSPWSRTLLPSLLLASVLAAGTAFAASAEWLSLCSKCLSPSVTVKSGLGTSQAVAESRITPEEVKGYCENWSPSDPKSCVAEQMAGEDFKRTYRASADCPAGRLVAVDGNSYTLAGTWVGDIGVGRVKFRDAKGQIVGRSNAENGLALAQNWELLCPGRTRPAAPASASAAPRPTAPPPGEATAQFAVGQVVDAKFGTGWLPARVNAVRTTTTSRGREFAYDVTLQNGQRGVVPARMLRHPQ